MDDFYAILSGNECEFQKTWDMECTRSVGSRKQTRSNKKLRWEVTLMELNDRCTFNFLNKARIGTTLIAI